jgi:hypothetical protein
VNTGELVGQLTEPKTKAATSKTKTKDAKDVAQREREVARMHKIISETKQSDAYKKLRKRVDDAEAEAAKRATK